MRDADLDGSQVWNVEFAQMFRGMVLHLPQ